MEGAVRVFAGELSQSTLSVPGEDDASAAWVVTPSGAFCRLVFVAGALVEVQDRNGMIAARVADPTGAFDLACSGFNIPVTETIRKIPLPSFVSVFGRAQLYRREGNPVLTIRPEHVHVINRAIRDQWVITTARATLERLAMMKGALEGTCTDARVLQASAHYAPDIKDLDLLAGMAAGALEGVRPPEDAVPAVQADPRETIMEYIRAAGGPQGVSVEDILDMARMKAIAPDAALAAIESLIVEDECYQPRKGFVRPL